jgi:hypothetical protein
MSFLAQAELEFLVALIQEYTEKMPQATKLAVTKHAQDCVNVICGELNSLDILREAALKDSSLPQPPPPPVDETIEDA